MALGPLGLPHIFSSSHVDVGLPLEAVAKKVVVVVNHGGAAPAVQPPAADAVGGETTAFCCCFHYDQDRMTLGLPNTNAAMGI